MTNQLEKFEQTVTDPFRSIVPSGFFNFPFSNEIFNHLTGLKKTAAADVERVDDKTMVTIDLPGFVSEDISISLDRGVLSVRASNKIEETDESKQKERMVWRNIERMFDLGDGIDENSVSAQLKNGVLSIILGNKEITEKRRIEIAVE